MCHWLTIIVGIYVQCIRILHSLGFYISLTKHIFSTKGAVILFNIEERKMKFKIWYLIQRKTKNIGSVSLSVLMAPQNAFCSYPLIYSILYNISFMTMKQKNTEIYFLYAPAILVFWVLK